MKNMINAFLYMCTQNMNKIDETLKMDNNVQYSNGQTYFAQMNFILF